METKDTNGNILSNGDSVQLTQDLKVKGAGMTLKQGHVLKKIRLIDDPENIECKVGRAIFVLKTCYLKKRK
ncbi:MAG: alkylphosphonate utilization protein [Candidatus Magasanikbacteria bacterium]|jgi:protein PhnA|nr:alkylphosphonate utilization protein [Candidatus Magasanikbacteria bacterium]MBT4221120.1 alkylphosphonate utilization protein [Candidatus Magasanikbacteria bacterium]MBT4350310.1 alkylphosphonate utilization protein [Candidatus Magasanikbacteria bacterium]MBT4541736.1 alkylphosphonate utilization protein [Candidatus Magasanikbacteria bacterium]MBT6253287.1 alkylphosphonate utilization protein [Candidatus Magasanikbacteria bacterium]